MTAYQDVMRMAERLRAGMLVSMPVPRAERAWCPWCFAERSLQGLLLHVADHCSAADATSKALAWEAVGHGWDEPGWPAGLVLADHLESSGHAAAANALRLRTDVTRRPGPAAEAPP